MDRALRMTIAGGGTGGHVFPGIAIAEAVAERTPCVIQWIGTGRPVEKEALMDREWEYKVLEVRPLSGTSFSQLTASFLHLPLPLARATGMLRRFGPDVVVGLGGYVSGPVVMAAWLTGRPAVLHEQNLVPGLANRMAARFAKRICVSFEETVAHFPPGKTVVTGNPVRPSLLSGGLDRPSGTAKRILVMGGSQGARGINTLVSSALVLVAQSGMEIEVLHQSGRADIDEVKEKYDSTPIKATVVPFITDMAHAYNWADLVVCRAGASTIAELTVLGKPSVLIPFPAAAGDHQDKNARVLESRGAALVCREEETGAVRFASLLQELLSDPDKLARMRQNAKKMGIAGAASKIAGIILETVEKERR